MTPFGTGIWAATLLAAACSSSSDDHVPGVSSGGANAETGGASGHSGSGSAGRSSLPAGGRVGATGANAEDAGASGETGGGVGGEGGLEQGMVVPVTPSACSDTAVWKEGSAVPQVSSAAKEKLLSITADELDLLFLRDSNVLLAHREHASDPFAEATPLSLPSGYDVNAGAALSADGKTLILVSSDGQSFASVSRSTRTAAFDGATDVSAFTLLNQFAPELLVHYAAPVLAPSGKTFVFTAFTPMPAQGFPTGFAGTADVYESPWSDGRWEQPANISHGIFEGSGVARPLASGLSADSRTLFYFDEATSQEFARFRDRPDAPFSTLLDLGERAGAAPNLACNTLYYFSNGDVLSAGN
jgi:hypothetical protein